VKSMKENYKEIYDKYWKENVEDENGNLDKDKVMRELADYWFVLGEVPKVYCHVTGNRISKPNTYASEVISEADEHYNDIHADIELPKSSTRTMIRRSSEMYIV